MSFSRIAYEITLVFSPANGLVLCLRRLLRKHLPLAARQVEAVAAKHRRAEPAHQALRDAMTRTELVLSVFERRDVAAQKEGRALMSKTSIPAS